MGNISAFGRHSVVARVSASGELVTRVADVRPPAGADASRAPAAEKYEIEATLGEGGMGEVMLVRDRDLQRQVAMKVLRETLADDASHRLRFVAEAQATSQLEHPGIPPVHDMGIAPSGRVYFTMKLVRGRTLAAILADLRHGDEHVDDEYSLHRLVSILERIAEALHFAHEKGVIHRDLKPENIMLGEFGEVHVMDWGIAKFASTGGGGDATTSFVTTAGTGESMTVAGAIAGTIPYMSPEQARGEPDIDRRSDVYALGCLLYEMLTLCPAFEGTGMDLLRRVREGAFPAVARRNPERRVPAPLAALCTRTMARDRAHRPATARAFGDELRSWLDGRAERARRHEEAEALAAQGREASRRFVSLRGEIADAERVAEGMERAFKPWQSHAEKTPLYEARERAQQARQDAAVAFGDATSLLNAALAAEERNPTALRALSDLWADRLATAERKGAADDVAYALTMIHRYDDGTRSELIAGDGSLTLRTKPPRAQVTLFRFEDRHGILVPDGGRSLGATPLATTALPMGSYLCVVRKEGFRDVRYPVHITRNRHWDDVIRLRTEEELGSAFVYVPGGPFIRGMADEATEVHVDDFAIQRYPVTFAEYAEFLAALEASEGPDAVALHVPRTSAESTVMARSDDGRWRLAPGMLSGSHAARYDRDFGDGWRDRLPVVGVSWHDANAYCAWKTRVSGREWRLPTRDEREKAARGVDGRDYPWGSAADASLCKNRDSRNEPSQPEPVGTFPPAVSVYGMGDAAGNVWDWTSSLYEPHPDAEEARLLRGGSWYLPVTFSRAASRHWNAPGYRTSNIGFRPARSVAT